MLQQKLTIRRPAVLCARAVGVLDFSIALSYLLGVGATSWYLAVLFIKLFVIALFKFPGRVTLRFHSLFVTCFSILLILSCWMGGASMATWLAAMGFVSQLTITLLAIRGEEIDVYLSAIGYFGFSVAVIYVAFALSGHIEQHYGRYQYFSGSHPNLGSELLAMAAIAAGITLSMRRVIPAIGVMLIAVYLMQGRAAMLVIILALLVRVYSQLSRRWAVLIPSAIAL